ncbi:hypothetical protein A2U01_0118203, partial [Trifolium medium]|nr:hypothetical protein [Trifolium medium]
MEKIQLGGENPPYVPH